MLTNSSIQSSASPTHQNERSSQTASTSRSIPAAKPGKDSSIAREQDAPAIPPASAFLLPSFQYVPTIPTEATALEAFCKGFVLPSQLHQSHDKLSREQKNILKRQPELQKQFIGARKINEILVLICGHGGRDEWCGKLGPILQKEFEDEIVGTYWETYAATAKGNWWLGNQLKYHYVPNTKLQKSDFNSALSRTQTSTYLWISTQIKQEELVLNEVATVTEADIPVTGVCPRQSC